MGVLIGTTFLAIATSNADSTGVNCRIRLHGIKDLRAPLSGSCSHSITTRRGDQTNVQREANLWIKRRLPSQTRSLICCCFSDERRHPRSVREMRKDAASESDVWRHVPWMLCG